MYIFTHCVHYFIFYLCLKESSVIRYTYNLIKTFTVNQWSLHIEIEKGVTYMKFITICLHQNII